MPKGLPVLYSFRRCPYAIRARMAIFASGLRVILREVDLKNKPAEMLDVSAKAEVPVLVLPEGQVLDESLDIMRWALARHDPANLLDPADGDFAAHPLVRMNDAEFKPCLDRYKYADRYPESTVAEYRQQGEAFLHRFESGLDCRAFFGGDRLSAVDLAIFPFVRQFAGVDKIWFQQAGYASLSNWLDSMLEHRWFVSVMHKFTPWRAGDPAIVFPPDE